MVRADTRVGMCADQLLVGRYRLVEVLGAGGMAEVRRARDVHLCREVAIKLFRSRPGQAAVHCFDNEVARRPCTRLLGSGFPMWKGVCVDRAETILGSMAAGVGEPAVQLAQTRFRVGLVDGWGIPAGASVLEIGCGQGDMTAVLAEAVGPTGRVVAVDIADPSYGAPVTLGDSAAFLLASPLGARIDLRFQVDVLDPAVSFGSDEFDYVVLAHCSWYFESIEQVDHVLGRIRPWARRLCFAEWDLRPDTLDQVPHLLAVLIQGQIEASGARGDGNVRTPFSREALVRGLGRTGWQVVDSRSVSAATLQDADWEIAACLATTSDVDQLSGLPGPVRDFVASQVDVLRSLAEANGNPPLPSYALVAHRD